MEQLQESIIDNSFSPEEKLQSEKAITTKQDHQPISAASTTTHKFMHSAGLSALRNPQYQQLSDNNTCVTKTHAAFLQARQESLRQMSEIIQLQIAFLQQVVDRNS